MSNTGLYKLKYNVNIFAKEDMKEVLMVIPPGRIVFYTGIIFKFENGITLQKVLYKNMVGWIGYYNSKFIPNQLVKENEIRIRSDL